MQSSCRSRTVQPDFLIIDSIRDHRSPQISQAKAQFPGTWGGQLNMQLAKTNNIAILSSWSCNQGRNLVFWLHMEHMVIRWELSITCSSWEQSHRFAPTNEIGIFIRWIGWSSNPSMLERLGERSVHPHHGRDGLFSKSGTWLPTTATWLLRSWLQSLWPF